MLPNVKYTVLPITATSFPDLSWLEAECRISVIGFGMEKFPIVIAELEDKVIGCLWSTRPVEGEIDWAVLEPYRKHGIATTMLSHFLENHGLLYERFTLTINDSGSAALANELGFKCADQEAKTWTRDGFSRETLEATIRLVQSRQQPTRRGN